MAVLPGDPGAAGIFVAFAGAEVDQILGTKTYPRHITSSKSW